MSAPIRPRGSVYKVEGKTEKIAWNDSKAYMNSNLSREINWFNGYRNHKLHTKKNNSVAKHPLKNTIRNAFSNQGTRSKIA